ncbi:hypothetical protein K661_01763 [Piscirickettsia salmonis LF-89 = ATCC VR-1361]|nr:hypothetical protein K661_01763 [Piscirickettsia salmonis LF-89 = ATCC VR-1361]
MVQTRTVRTKIIESVMRLFHLEYYIFSWSLALILYFII